MRTHWLCLLALIIVAPTFAATVTPTVPRVCTDQRSFERQAFEQNLYEMPNDISPIALAVINGNTAAVRVDLAGLSPDERQRWSPNVLDTAVLFGQAATVAALLDAGVSPNAPVVQLRLKPAVYQRFIAGFAQHLGTTPQTFVQEMQPLGLRNGGGPTWRPLFTAINCRELAMTKLLLRHGADPNYPYNHSQYPHSQDVPLLFGLDEKDVPILEALLNAGADVCAEDRRLDALPKERHDSIPTHTLAYMARHEGLPSSLVQRLTCHAPPEAN